MYKKPEFTTVSDSEAKTMVKANFFLGIPIYVIIVVVIAIEEIQLTLKTAFLF